MSTFLLVHGGGHRGWHWNLLATELARFGHRSVAPDVPMDDPEVGAAAWADVATEALGDADPKDTVVVGHSYAGLAVPVIGSLGAFRRLVFLCANVPVPGMSYADYMSLPENKSSVVMPPVDYDPRGRIVLDFEIARDVYYADVDESLARSAWERLTPNATTGFTETCPIDRWPDVPSSYVLCTEDRIIGPAWSRRVSETRLGAPAIELPGSHSPMLSRPSHLARVLDEVSRV
jgi:hypothetical protein